jgi:predicted secreted hydrolase
MTAEQDAVEIALELNDHKGVIFHGTDGYSQKGAEVGNASYYFSQTRLASKGILKVNNQEFSVTGLSWMDHEFSTSALSEGQVGWDWFSLQLDNDTEIMVFQIRQADGSVDPFSSGTLVGSNGDTQHLARSQFEIEVVNTWRSPNSEAVYPALWSISIPEIDLTLDIEPYMSDQELNVSYAYWEGAVGITGTLGEQVVTGSGYVELTGYAASMEGEF